MNGCFLLHRLESVMLRELVTFTRDGGKFPDLSEQLNFFQASFNREEAKKRGVIVPSPGVDTTYDSAITRIKELDNKLQDYLNHQRKRLNSKVQV